MFELVKGTQAASLYIAPGADDFAGNELFSCFVGTSWYETSGMATGMDCP